ncbi:MAG: hypothetical protein ACJ8F7_03840 [Gemmataceae bacterium]
MWALAALLAIALVIGIVGLLALPGAREVQRTNVFDQEIVVESDKPIRRVTYTGYDGPEEDLRREAAAGNPLLFNGTEAERLAADRFRAKIEVHIIRGILWSKGWYYPQYLVVSIEFADDSRTDSVIAVPPGMGQDPIIIHLR